MQERKSWIHSAYGVPPTWNSEPLHLRHSISVNGFTWEQRGIRKNKANRNTKFEDKYIYCMFDIVEKVLKIIWGKIVDQLKGTKEF